MSASVCGYVKQVFRQDKEGEVTLEVRTLFTPPETFEHVSVELLERNKRNDDRQEWSMEFDRKKT